jgi:hypothetical protein
VYFWNWFAASFMPSAGSRIASAKYFLGIAGSVAISCGVVQAVAAQALSAPTQEVYDSLAGLVTRPPLVLGAYAQRSFILNHTKAISHLAVSHPTGFELNAQRQTTGGAAWHGWYKYPKVGVALVYYDYHNPILGQSYAATVYLSKPFLRTRRQDLSFRLGTGLAWFTSPFDLQANRRNTIVSSSLNATLQLRL